MSMFKKLATGGIAVALAGTLLVAPFEGKVNKTYLDPILLVTSCFGHVSPDLKLGQTFTDDQCFDQLEKDLALHDKQLLALVHTPMNDFEHAAYLSFIYNVGANTFSKSTLLKKLNNGDHVEACLELDKWTYAGKQKLVGLERRRAAERQMCLGEAKITDKEILDVLKPPLPQ